MQIASSQKVALVTGANKGIGFEIARKLGKSGFKTVVACRDEALGCKAVETLRAEGCDATFCRVDLTEVDTIKAAASFVSQEYGRLDVLVNNAAVCFNDPTLYGKCTHTPFQQQAEISVRTNFFGTLAVTQSMLPLLRDSPSPRIVNIASAAGRLSILRSQDLVKEFTSPGLQIERLENLLMEFVSDVEAGTHAEKGWPNTCYGMSKLGIIALTKILARDETGVMVNCVDPGFCSTDQNANQGTRSAERGSVTPMLLATLSEDKEFVSGRYFFDEAEIMW